MVVIVFGLPGSGKSYFASHLARMLNAEYTSSDRLRKEIFRRRTYSEQEKKSVYRGMLKVMNEIESQNRNLVLDATFYKSEFRELFIHKDQEQSQVFFIEIRANENLIRRRLKQERRDSEANFKVYELIKQRWEPMKEYHLILESTDDNINYMLEKAVDYLSKKNE